MGHIQMADTQNTELDSLMFQLQQLESEIETINKEELKIRKQLYQIKSRENKQEIRPTTEELVVTFVKEIEKAEQFFEFCDYLTQNSDRMKQDKDQYASFKRLVDERVHQTYTLLDFEYIMEAVEGWWRGFPVLNPLTKLLYQRDKGYTLNEDPIYELRKIKKEDCMFYTKVFKWKLLENYSENKVVVRSVPIEFTEDEVRELLKECGEVVTVEFDYSLATWDKIVHATFKDSVSAMIAPILMKPTCCTTSRYPEPPLEPEIPSRSKYNEAREKYAELRNPGKKISNKRGTAADITHLSTSDGAFSRLDDMLIG